MIAAWLSRIAERQRINAIAAAQDRLPALMARQRERDAQMRSERTRRGNQTRREERA